MHDVDVGGYPDWPADTDPYVVSSEGVVAVSTQPEHEGEVLVEVWTEGEVPQLAADTAEVFDGEIASTEGKLAIGATTSTYGAVRVEKGRHRLRVFAEPPGYAHRVVFVMDGALRQDAE